jgi:hypothetical protein
MTNRCFACKGIKHRARRPSAPHCLKAPSRIKSANLCSWCDDVATSKPYINWWYPRVWLATPVLLPLISKLSMRSSVAAKWKRALGYLARHSLLHIATANIIMYCARKKRYVKKVIWPTLRPDLAVTSGLPDIAKKHAFWKRNCFVWNVTRFAHAGLGHGLLLLLLLLPTRSHMRVKMSISQTSSCLVGTKCLKNKKEPTGRQLWVSWQPCLATCSQLP